MTWKLSQRSLDNLKDVHPDLIKVIMAALVTSPYDFGIIEGKRSIERQRELFALGKSRTLNSRHLVGKAVDFDVFVDGAVTWDEKYYEAVSVAFKECAKELGIPVVWGGDFPKLYGGTFVDSDHLELERHAYPDQEPLIS